MMGAGLGRREWREAAPSFTRTVSVSSHRVLANVHIL